MGIFVRIVLAQDWQETSEEWLIPSLLCDSLTLLSGEPKTGKTALACHIARALITNESILDCQPIYREFRVGYMGFDPKWQREVRQRTPELLGSLYFIDPINFKETSEWDSLSVEVIRLGINFLIIDHLYGLGAGADLDRQVQMQEVLLPIHKLMSTSGAGVLLVAHAPKGSAGRAAHSMASEGAARWLLRLKGSGKARSLESLGNNGETQKRSIRLTPFEIALTNSGTNEKKDSKNADGLMPERARYIINSSPMELRNSARALGKWLSEQNIGITDTESGRSAVNNLLAGQLLKRQGRKGEITAGPKLVL